MNPSLRRLQLRTILNKHLYTKKVKIKQITINKYSPYVTQTGLCGPFNDKIWINNHNHTSRL